MGLDMPLAKRWGHVICFEQTDSGLELATSFDDDDDESSSHRIPALSGVLRRCFCVVTLVRGEGREL